MQASSIRTCAVRSAGIRYIHCTNQQAVLPAATDTGGAADCFASSRTQRKRLLRHSGQSDSTGTPSCRTSLPCSPPPLRCAACSTLTPLNVPVGTPACADGQRAKPWAHRGQPDDAQQLQVRLPQPQLLFRLPLVLAVRACQSVMGGISKGIRERAANDLGLPAPFWLPLAVALRAYQWETSIRPRRYGLTKAVYAVGLPRNAVRLHSTQTAGAARSRALAQPSAGRAANTYQTQWQMSSAGGSGASRQACAPCALSGTSSALTHPPINGAVAHPLAP